MFYTCDRKNLISLSVGCCMSNIIYRYNTCYISFLQTSICLVLLGCYLVDKIICRSRWILVPRVHKTCISIYKKVHFLNYIKVSESKYGIKRSFFIIKTKDLVKKQNTRVDVKLKSKWFLIETLECPFIWNLTIYK